MISLKRVFPTNNQFNELFTSVGWGTREDEKINMHRKMSCYSVCAFDNDNIVAMARVVGDGSYYTVFDVVVKKEYKKKVLAQ